MSENVQEKKSSSKLVPILLIVVIVLLIGGIVAAVVLLTKNNSGDDPSAEGDGEAIVTIGYEGNGVVALDEDELKRILEEMQREADEGMIDLTYKNVAVSTDGVHFACDLGNSPSNRYDMYFNIYLDNDINKQVLLTGLVPPGSSLSTFESEIPFEPGNYTSTLVITQVGDDHGTIVGQVMVVLELIVGEPGEIDTDIFVE
ncbi:MAG: hypothetical protein J1E40_11385 [Oscillospiraceae bacterium]|nr:hypothetical protein [Oscillospiraceae bacterium]